MSLLSHYRDLAMLLRDPYAINVICGSILKTLSMLMQHEKLPRVSKICTCIFCTDFSLFLAILLSEKLAHMSH